MPAPRAWAAGGDFGRFRVFFTSFGHARTVGFMDARRRVGNDGEAVAAKWLERRGWAVVDRNVRYREGEIDLICSKDGLLAFVEVKARRSTRAGTGAEAVTPAKQARIRRCAMRYLTERQPRAAGIRFDVVELRVRGDTFSVRHLEGAF